MAEQRRDAATDRYGGTTQASVEATGFFRIARIGERWWLVTPEGNAFWAVGFNHIVRERTRAPYNREHWDALVSNDQEFCDYVERDVRSLNMTALGYGIDDHDAVLRTPYVKKRARMPAPMTWAWESDFPDVFAPEYAEHCDSIARDVFGPFADDPLVIGNYVCDCVDWPAFGRASKRRNGSWTDRLMRLGSQAPGKRAYVSLVTGLYQDDVSAFNRVYRTDYSAFDDLLHDAEFSYNAPTDIDLARRDHDAFLELLADRFYSVTCDAVRRYDSNHLVFGEVFDANREIPEPVLRAATRQVDALSLQWYGYFKDQAARLEEIHRFTGKPVLLGDSCFAVATDEMPTPCGVVVESPEERAVEFERYARQAMRVPYVLGWFWCGYIDSPIERRPGRLQHTGIKTTTGDFHKPLATAMRRTWGDMYETLLGPDHAR